MIKTLISMLLFLLVCLPAYGSNGSELATRFVDLVGTGQPAAAEKLLAIDADADLRLALLNPEDARAHGEAFRKLAHHSTHTAPGEIWVIYQVRGSAEYLLFAITGSADHPRIHRMVPLAVPTVRVARLSTKDQGRKSSQTAEILQTRIRALPFVTAAGQSTKGFVEIHTAGFTETADLKILLTVQGQFTLRRLTRRSRERLPWAPMAGLARRDKEAVARGSLLENAQIRRATAERNTLGLVEVKLETDPEGRRRLIREIREGKGEKEQYAAVLDGMIVRRVTGNRSFQSGIIFLEGVPRPEDAQILAALLSAPPLDSALKLEGIE